MDSTSLMEIPLDMLSFLDGEISNPELYQVNYYYHFFSLDYVRPAKLITIHPSPSITSTVQTDRGLRDKSQPPDGKNDLFAG